jgi:hypothetical protein
MVLGLVVCVIFDKDDVDIAAMRFILAQRTCFVG